MKTDQLNGGKTMYEKREIKLPIDILPKEKFDVLPSTEKERYIRNVLKSILSSNQNGVTAPQLAEATKISRVTIWRHLEEMTITREAYKLEYGHTSIYYANGRMLHHLFKEDLRMGANIYAFILLKNNLGDFVYLQEKHINRLGIPEISGGLLIPLKEFETFIDLLNDANREVVKYVQANKS